MNPFDRDFGIYQGRITLDGNSYVYELGHAMLAEANVAPGDFHQVEQLIQFAPTSRFVRAQVVIVTPKQLPVGAAWEFSTFLDGTQMTQRRLRRSKRVIVLDDLRISLRDVLPAPAQTHLVFRLELVT